MTRDIGSDSSIDRSVRRRAAFWRLSLLIAVTGLLPVSSTSAALSGPPQDLQAALDLPTEVAAAAEFSDDFDRTSLRLIEPLRAMRYVHYTAWCVRQAADGGFARLAPDWGSPSYWKQEILELQKQQVEIRDAVG